MAEWLKPPLHTLFIADSLLFAFFGTPHANQTIALENCAVIMVLTNRLSGTGLFACAAIVAQAGVNTHTVLCF